MKNSFKKKLLSGILAAVTFLGVVAVVPTVVKADDIDGFLDNLNNLTPQEIHVLKHLDDLDNDGDLDEDDIEALETLLTMDQLDEYDKNLIRHILHHAFEHHNDDDNVSVTGIYLSSQSISLIPGQTYQDVAYVQPDNASNQGISYSTSDPNVAIVDPNGVVTGISPGSCILFAISNDGNYSARACIQVTPAPSVIAQTQSDDAAWMSNAAAIISATPAGGTANLVATKPMNFNAAVISAFQSRPDVSILLAFPYKGHSYLMSIPAGYNLASKVNASGTVSFLSLSAVNDGLINCVMVQ
ncbi:MAG: Ig-like domain-containing protein [Lachnospiraceae bacterium]|nr:Ig-like domain-containing protein [Lachnospiraceae bacterium]